VIEAVSKADVGRGGSGPRDDPGAMPKFVKELIPKLKVPFLLDADALNPCRERATDPAGAAAPCILTPHPGEMARLTKETIESIEVSRIRLRPALRRGTGHGDHQGRAPRIVATPEGGHLQSHDGNPYMALRAGWGTP